ncbi:MAG: DUF481 domain-containing protein [Sphingopyxis macrogoltabida]|uniref:DUF481 domain-containing protein n=1 Tax=Sphingopyxis macrogoltabida TaxID=33050 RepID=A0A2W5N8H0_SPHMC|nr:MAG: DUF481 domain-containing protein [Sphingopyxis macrogoltabida]
MTLLSPIALLATLTATTQPQPAADPALSDPLLTVQPPVVPAPSEPVLPESVRAMLDAAIAGGKDADVETVARLARKTYPDGAPEVDRILADYRDTRTKARAAQTAAARARLAQAKFWQNWKGEGQIGATLATGNTRSRGLSAGLALARKGIDWDNKFRAQADYQRSNGRTSVERFLVEVEPRYKLGARAFAYGLGRWEQDEILGYDTRWSVSGGFGYKLIDSKTMSLSLKGGPAWRRTDFVRGDRDSELTGLAGVDFGWQLSPTLRLTQAASTTLGEENSQTSALTALNAKLTGALSARLAYSAEIDTNPPPGIEKLDTLTRFTLVYGF